MLIWLYYEEYFNVYRLALFPSIVSALNGLNPEYSYKNGFPFKDPTTKSYSIRRTGQPILSSVSVGI